MNVVYKSPPSLPIAKIPGEKRELLQGGNWKLEKKHGDVKRLKVNPSIVQKRIYRNDVKHEL